jgi:hypothetical protein
MNTEKKTLNISTLLHSRFKYELLPVEIQLIMNSDAMRVG